MKFSELTKIIQAEMDKNPGFLHTKANVLLLVDGSCVEVNCVKIDEDKDLILSNEMEIY